MASRTASCQFCSASFTGYGETGKEAEQDARNQQMNHEFNCPQNPANGWQEG